MQGRRRTRVSPPSRLVALLAMLKNLPNLPNLPLTPLPKALPSSHPSPHARPSPRPMVEGSASTLATRLRARGVRATSSPNHRTEGSGPAHGQAHHPPHGSRPESKVARLPLPPDPTEVQQRPLKTRARTSNALLTSKSQSTANPQARALLLLPNRDVGVAELGPARKTVVTLGRISHFEGWQNVFRST